jgi:hypothetical protein
MDGKQRNGPVMYDGPAARVSRFAGDVFRLRLACIKRMYKRQDDSTVW